MSPSPLPVFSQNPQFCCFSRDYPLHFSHAISYPFQLFVTVWLHRTHIASSSSSLFFAFAHIIHCFQSTLCLAVHTQYAPVVLLNPVSPHHILLFYYNLYLYPVFHDIRLAVCFTIPLFNNTTVSLHSPVSFLAPMSVTSYLMFPSFHFFCLILQSNRTAPPSFHSFTSLFQSKALFHLSPVNLSTDALLVSHLF